jgi:hypothetical protein
MTLESVCPIATDANVLAHIAAHGHDRAVGTHHHRMLIATVWQ